MARKRRQLSALDQAICRWLDKQPPDGAIARIGYCTAVSFVLQEKRRGWYFVITACMILSILLPFLVYMIALRLLGHEQFSGFPDLPLFGLG